MNATALASDHVRWSAEQWLALPKASAAIGALVGEADRILDGRVDEKTAERVETISNEIAMWRAKMSEHPSWVGDAEEMLLLALGQVINTENAPSSREKWARIANYIKQELVGENLLSAFAREARPTP